MFSSSTNQSRKQRIIVLLIAPSKYDDQGFVHRYLKGVITTPGLCTMSDLTRQALSQITKPKKTLSQIITCEDSVFWQVLRLNFFYWLWLLRWPFYRLFRLPVHLIVGLVSVQSHQLPRATDLIQRWQKRGATCVIGGPHITGAITAMLDGLGNRGDGSIPCPHTMPSEITALQQSKAIIFHGEAEPHPDGSFAWRDALANILRHSPHSLYRGGQPDITNTPLPKLYGYATKYFSRRLVPVNEARGCPFRCKFCSVVTNQGRVMRCRSPQIIVEYFRVLSQRYGRARVFITGDNFARNKYQRRILAGLSQLRQAGHKITFMVQADLDACLKDPTLVPRLAQAGCNMIFFGVESLNSKNLVSAGKKHNVGRDLPALWRQCHQQNIIVHAAYMIGFPFDSPASVAADTDKLFTYGADHVSFYIRGPIPGCEDWIRLHCAGQLIAPDMNIYDSFHCPTDFDLNMSQSECEQVFRLAWSRFYTLPRMISIRQRFSDINTRRGLLLIHIWYWWAIKVENTHPMIAGFYRFRPYWDRRPGTTPLSFPRYLVQEIWRHLRYIGFWLAAFYLFQQVELETEYNLSGKKDAITGKSSGLTGWASRTFGPLMDRSWLNQAWKNYAHYRWQLLNPLWVHRHFQMIPFAITEAVYTLRWAVRFRRIIKNVRA